MSVSVGERGEVQRYIRRSDVAAPPRRPACLYQFPEVRRAPAGHGTRVRKRLLSAGGGAAVWGLGWGYLLLVQYFLVPVPGWVGIYM